MFIDKRGKNMAKKNKAKETKQEEIKQEVKGHLSGELSKKQGISRRGKIVIACGIGLLVLGFFVLSKTNPEGSNWASILSPLLIIGGYVTIGVGIIV